MNAVDSLNSSAYFSAAALASKQTKKEQESSKTQKTKRTVFSSLVDKTMEEESLISAGLPPEIAGMETEEAIVFLKDAVDSTADALSDVVNAQNFAAFKKSVGQFLKFIERNNYEVCKTKRFGKTRKKSVFFEEVRPKDPYVQVRVVNEKLNALTAMVLQNHSDKLALLAKVEEIKGLLVDFFAD